MAKNQDAKKSAKKAPLKTAKEKKAEKEGRQSFFFYMIDEEEK